MEKPKGQYLFLMRGADWGGGLSPEQVASSLERMFAWIDEMKDTGVMSAGQPLASVGAVIRSTEGLVVDGPFVEAKEAVGGYLIISTSSYEEALGWARACPVLKHGLVIEVRPMADNCHLAEEVGMAVTTMAP